MKKYIAKKDTWFLEGSEVKLIDDYRIGHPYMDTGLFSGKRKCQVPKAELHKLGELYDDEEVCPWDEFEIVDG